MPILRLPSRWVLLKTTLAFSKIHWPRTLLLIFGIALGVAAVIAIDIAKSSVGNSFSLSTNLLTGKATHRIVGSDFRIDQQIFVDLKMKLGIESAAPVISEYVKVAAFDEKEMQLIGIDPFSEAAFRNFSTQSTRTLPILEPLSVMISEAMATRFGVGPGGHRTHTIDLSFGKETQSVTVAGFLSSSEPWLNQAYDGIILCDISTAQEILKMGSEITHIDLILGKSGHNAEGHRTKNHESEEIHGEKDHGVKGQDEKEVRDHQDESAADRGEGNGSEVERQAAAIRAMLPEGATLIRTAQRNATIRSLSRSFETSLSAFSMLSLFMAMFLIYNTVSFSVAQRRRLIGILRSLGATRQGIFNMILMEILCYALVGAFLGMGLGILLGKGAVQAVCQTVSGIYFPLTVSQTHVTLSVLIKGMMAGTLSAVAASLLPALEATRFPPVTLAVRSDSEARMRRRVPLLAVMGGALLGLAFIIFITPHTGAGIDFVALFMTFTGAAFLVPYLTIASIHGLNAPLKYLHARQKSKRFQDGKKEDRKTVAQSEEPSSKGVPIIGIHNNGHVRPPDTAKHERIQTTDPEFFQINPHGLPPTTNNESLDMSLAINSFQINAHGLPPTTNNESLDMPLAINSFQIKLKNGLFQRLRPTVLTVMALNNIVRGLSRTTILIASLMVVISVYIGIGTMTASFRQSVVTWVDDNIGGDIHIRSADHRLLSLDPRFVRQVLALPEVARASTYSVHRVFSNQSGEVHVFSYKTDHSKKEWVWTTDHHDTRFNHDGWIYISEIFAQNHGISGARGGDVLLLTQHGEQVFHVAGIFRDFFMGGGRIIVNRKVMKKFWGFSGITSIQLFLAPDVINSSVVDPRGEDGIGRTMLKIRDLMENRRQKALKNMDSAIPPPIEMRRGDTIKEGVLSVFDQTFMITIAMQLLTAIVALTGIVNSVMALLLERVREIGILRACGAEVRQVTGLLLVECGVCGWLAGLFAVPLGGFISWVLIDVINRRSFGWTYDLVFQMDIFIQAVGFALIAALVAAAIPARQMGKRNIAASLRME